MGLKWGSGFPSLKFILAEGCVPKILLILPSISGVILLKTSTAFKHLFSWSMFLAPKTADEAYGNLITQAIAREVKSVLSSFSARSLSYLRIESTFSLSISWSHRNWAALFLYYPPLSSNLPLPCPSRYFPVR